MASPGASSAWSEQPTAVYRFRDAHDDLCVDWQSAWIDLGGEG
jgi:hypothetical protein